MYDVLYIKKPNSYICWCTVYGVQCTSQLKALRRGAFGPVHKATLHPIELGAQRNMESILGFSRLKQEHKITKLRLKTVTVCLGYACLGNTPDSGSGYNGQDTEYITPAPTYLFLFRLGIRKTHFLKVYHIENSNYAK